MSEKKKDLRGIVVEVLVNCVVLASIMRVLLAGPFPRGFTWTTAVLLAVILAIGMRFTIARATSHSSP